MLDFEYYTPTKVFFGKGREKEVGKIISQYGYKKIMLQYGKGSIKKNGLIEPIYIRKDINNPKKAVVFLKVGIYNI